MSDKDILFKSLQKILKVAEVKLDKQQEESVKAIISELKDYTLRLVWLRDNNPNKFLDLVTSKEKRDSLNQNPLSIPYDLEKNIRLFEGIELISNIFFRIWKGAFLKDQKTTANYLLYTLHELVLKIYKQNSDNLSFINYFLSNYYEINRVFIQSKEPTAVNIDLTLYRWYLDIVFDISFTITQIYEFQKTLFWFIKYVIVENQVELFKNFIRSIINGPYYYHLFSLRQIPFELYANNKILYSEVQNFFENIVTDASRLINREQFNKIQDIVSKYKTALDSIIDLSEDEKVKLISNIEEFVLNSYKYNCLKTCVIWLGTYCLFKQKYEFIEELLFFNQPKDTSATWSNEDINPINFNEILYLSNESFEIDRQVVPLWDDHHDFNPYYDQYIIILLANAINHSLRKGQTNFTENIGFFNNYKKQKLEHTISRIKTLRFIVSQLKEDENILIKIGFSNTIKSKVEELLSEVIKKCENLIDYKEQVAIIDEEIVDRFKNMVLEDFMKNASLRNIFKVYSKFSEKADEENTYIDGFGIKELSPKAYFDRNDDSTFIGWPEGYSRKLIFLEDINLMQQLVTPIRKDNKSIKIEESKIFMEISSLDLSDKIVILRNIYPFPYFGDNKNFVAKSSSSNSIVIKEFIGNYYKSDVYYYYDGTPWKQALVFSKSYASKIKIKQFLPFSKEKCTEQNMKDFFYFTIKSFSAESKLLSDFIENKPQWLEQEKEPERYLNKHVLIEVYEKMQLELPDDFIGWFYYV